MASKNHQNATVHSVDQYAKQLRIISLITVIETTLIHKYEMVQSLCILAYGSCELWTECCVPQMANWS
jgi:hypothetical protein